MADGFFGTIGKVVSDAYYSFLEDIGLNGNERKNAAEWNDKFQEAGLKIHKSNDRTQHLSTEKPIDAFLGEDKNGQILNQGNAAERVNTYMLAKFGGSVGTSAEDKARAINIRNNLMASMSGHGAHDAVQKALDAWIDEHFSQ